MDGPRGKPIVIWSYLLESSGSGTAVTESFELPRVVATRIYERVAGAARTRTNLKNMRATLERLREVAESTDPGISTS